MSPQVYARVGGAFYAAIFVAAYFALVVPSQIIVPGNADASAAHILAAAQTWRWSSTIELLMFSCDIVLAAIFYFLFRPVSAGIALVASLFRFAEAIFGCINTTWHFAAVVVPAAQLPSLVLTFLNVHETGMNAALLLFGIHCVLLGYLIFESGYLPKVLGVLLVIAGVGYCLNSLASFVAPRLEDTILPVIFLLPALPAELGLCLWLLIKGVNQPKWDAAVGRSMQSSPA